MVMNDDEMTMLQINYADISRLLWLLIPPLILMRYSRTEFEWTWIIA